MVTKDVATEMLTLGRPALKSEEGLELLKELLKRNRTGCWEFLEMRY